MIDFHFLHEDCKFEYIGQVLAFSFLVYFAKSSFGNPILPFNCCCSSDSRNVWERGIFKRKLKVCESFRKFTKIGIAINLNILDRFLDGFHENLFFFVVEKTGFF
jgi:hypothetical protein